MTSFRQALCRRQVLLGSWLQVGHPTAAEALAAAGFAWLAVDAEHTEADIETQAAIMRALHGRGVAPLVRVIANEPLAIRRALDLGAAGVIVPLVETAAQAAAAVAAAKYPPAGVRGFAFCRANDYGASFADYAATANDATAVVVMIESRRAVDNIAAILAVPGVDGVFIGPYDLSGSYGIPGQTTAPPVVEGCRRVVAACAAAGKAAGVHVVEPTETAVADALAAGYTFVALGVDTVFLRQGGAAALAAAGRSA